jgi:glucosylceramidase
MGKAEMASKVHDAHPDAEMHWTEGGPDYTSPDYQTDWAKWGQVFSGAVNNWCRSVTAWNLALDEKGRPNIGPFPCGGLVTIHSQTKEITRSGQYWAFAHFSRMVRRGARRFDSQSTISGISHVAFENPDAGRTLVVTNAGAVRQVALQTGGLKAVVNLDGNSVTTFSWS